MTFDKEMLARLVICLAAATLTLKAEPNFTCEFGQESVRVTIGDAGALPFPQTGEILPLTFFIVSKDSTVRLMIMNKKSPLARFSPTSDSVEYAVRYESLWAAAWVEMDGYGFVKRDRPPRPTNSKEWRSLLRSGKLQIELFDGHAEDPKKRRIRIPSAEKNSTKEDGRTSRGR